MLVNATQPEELRVALVDGQWLFDLDIENPGREQKKGNIYKARIVRFEPSLEALFVYFGSDRHGFLPLREVAHHHFAKAGIEELNRSNIREILPEGSELLIQVDKEERGSKGAALTTFISLAGCYLVLMPNNPRAGGISRRVDGEERAELREVLSALDVPEGMGLIIRTAGVGRRLEELQWDLNVLLSQWKAIQEAASNRQAPALIHQEGNVVIRAVRDYLRPDIDEILVDDPSVFKNIQRYIEMVRPDFLPRVKLYQDTIPLFNRYQIEGQIVAAFRRSVELPSGGALVIDHTEALVSIDINSARATKGVDIEETALHTNLEAADEIARQLRVRDLGGLIVIDFIDMVSPHNQRMVENRLREAVEMDRARIQIGRISRFGLLEMSRQRLRPVLGESTLIPCPRCEGQGSIRGVDSQALIVLRVIEEEAFKEHTSEVYAELPVDVATYIINEKRKAIIHIEKQHQVKIIIIPNPQLVNPHYNVNRVRSEDIVNRVGEPVSYKMMTKIQPRVETPARTMVAQQPAVKSYIHTLSAPEQKSDNPSLIKRLWGTFFGAENAGSNAEPVTTQPSKLPSEEGMERTPASQRPPYQQRDQRNQRRHWKQGRHAHHKRQREHAAAPQGQRDPRHHDPRNPPEKQEGQEATGFQENRENRDNRETQRNRSRHHGHPHRRRQGQYGQGQGRGRPDHQRSNPSPEGTSSLPMPIEQQPKSIVPVVTTSPEQENSSNG